MGHHFRQLVLFMAALILLLPTVGFAGALPDTGQTQCYDDQGNVIPCPQPGQPFYGQDGCYNGPQHSYTKLGQNGVALPDSATVADGWIMTRDNVTGLIWEVKQNKDGVADYSNPHDADNLYTWYDPDSATNGGVAGTQGNGTTTFDTQQFINALNNAHFGGYSDWRLPTVKELSWLVDSGIPYPGPTISQLFFPDTVANYYLSSTTYAYVPNDAWCVGFYSGYVSNGNKSYGFYVRAVRAGQ